MIATAQYSVDGTAVKLISASQTAKVVVVHNIGSGTIFLNGANTVSSTTGFALDKAAGPFEIQLAAPDELWAISGSGTHITTVFEVHQ